jgi:adenylate cyclase
LLRSTRNDGVSVIAGSAAAPQSPAMATDTASVVRWLIEGAPTAGRAEEIMQQMCERICACGIPLWRSSVFVRTLHPDIMGRRFTWQPDKGIDWGEAPYQVMEGEDYRLSPVVRVYETGAPVRRRIADSDCPMDFAVLAGFRDEGVTDYLALPLIFTNGEIHVATWTTRQQGGFDEAQVTGLENVAAPLARVAEIYALRRTARNLLDTYVGAHTGERILKGQIRRGDTEAIEAAIWLSDMRGFTALSDRIAPASLVRLLNRYFDAQVPAIAKHGGEVLKFIGDGLLAIFPVEPGDARGAHACAAALAAAQEARTAIAALGQGEAIEGVERVRFGLALHIGEVLYGNVGGGTRLDFTCIGPAVNLAARIEKLAGELGRTVLASIEFAERCPGALEPVGRFSVRGIEASQRVFGLAEEADRGP